MIKLGTDGYLMVLGLTDVKTNIAIDDATVTAAILPAEGNDTPLANSSITLALKSAGGNYDGTFPNTVSMVKGDTYRVQVTAIAGELVGDPQHIWEEEFVAERDRFA